MATPQTRRYVGGVGRRVCTITKDQETKIHLPIHGARPDPAMGHETVGDAARVRPVWSTDPCLVAFRRLSCGPSFLILLFGHSSGKYSVHALKVPFLWSSLPLFVSLLSRSHPHPYIVHSISPHILMFFFLEARLLTLKAHAPCGDSFPYDVYTYNLLACFSTCPRLLAYCFLTAALCIPNHTSELEQPVRIQYQAP
jgi:hypothetical protein